MYNNITQRTNKCILGMQIIIPVDIKGDQCYESYHTYNNTQKYLHHDAISDNDNLNDLKIKVYYCALIINHSLKTDPVSAVKEIHGQKKFLP